jgi:hypothetical protein
MPTAARKPSAWARSRGNRSPDWLVAKNEVDLGFGQTRAVAGVGRERPFERGEALGPKPACASPWGDDAQDLDPKSARDQRDRDAFANDAARALRNDDGCARMRAL